MKFEIFRTYDIRGQWLIDFKEQDLFAIFGGFLAYFKHLDNNFCKIVIGRDARPSSKVIHDIFIKFALQQGLEVIDLELCTTPMVNMAYHFDESCKFRVMITASHNPWSHNGFKLFYKNQAVWRGGLETVAFLTKEICTSESQSVLQPTVINRQEQSSCVLIKEYEQILTKTFCSLPKTGEVSFLVDCMHGAVGPTFKKILEQVPNLKVSFFRETPYCELESRDSVLPAPDPSCSTNLIETISELKKRELPFAMLFDGDGDRFVIVLACGKILTGDELLALFAEMFLQKNERFVANVASSVLLELVASRSDLFVCRVPVGVASLKEVMQQDNLLLGGEPSAHFLFLKEHFCIDDGLFAAYKFLQVLALPSFSLEKWLEDLPRTYSTPIQKIFFQSRQEVLLMMNLLTKKFEKAGCATLQKDGIRIFFSDFSWILMRASNTESCISLRIEADTEDRFTEIKKFLTHEVLPVLAPVLAIDKIPDGLRC